jgi:hypothetical protein
MTATQTYNNHQESTCKRGLTIQVKSKNPEKSTAGILRYCPTPLLGGIKGGIHKLEVIEFTPALVNVDYPQCMLSDIPVVKDTSIEGTHIRFKIDNQSLAIDFCPSGVFCILDPGIDQ